MSESDLKTTILDPLHRSLGARMIPFAGYDMPVHYQAGVMAEHRHTRTRAGLFDVSHMGQVRLAGPTVATDLEMLVPGDIKALTPGAMRYTLLTSATGGIFDDLIVTNAGDHFIVVVNATRKTDDIGHLRIHLDCSIEVLDHALLALQGPAAEAVLESLVPGVAELGFMRAGSFEIAGTVCMVSRSGYTGEDGFEISITPDRAQDLAEMLLAHDDVAPIGLGARDSLRLEAGLCLYGQDLTPDTTPVEAALAWTIGKRRRIEGGFPGAERVLSQLAEGAPRRRVGLRPDGRAPARAGTEITDTEGVSIGVVTSGGYGPSIGAPIAMGYVTGDPAAGTAVNVVVRGKPLPATIAAMPFVKANYKRG